MNVIEIIQKNALALCIVGIASVIVSSLLWVSPLSLLSVFSNSAEAQSFSVSVTASSNEIDEGESVSISWSSTGAHSCTGVGFSTGGTTSGSKNVAPSAEGQYDYTVTCTSSSPACSWSNTSTLVEDFCPSSTCGSLSSACSPQGASCRTVTGSGICTIKYYSCSGPCTTASDTVAVTVNPGPPEPGEPPVLDFSSSIAAISYGESALLSWSALGGTFCTSDDFDTGGATTSSATVQPTVTTTYTIECEGEPAPSQGTYSGGTWQYEFTDYTDLWCPATQSYYTQCTSSNPEGQSCSPGNTICGVDSGECTIRTDVYRCTGGTWTEGDPGAPATTTESIVVTVAQEPELTADTPSLYSGALVDGVPVTFVSVITNGGNLDITGSFDVRFQLDIDNNGVYDINFDSLDEISGLSQSQSKNGVSQQWTAEEGTHAIRACADLPGNNVNEANEGNNCSGNYVFTVNSSIQCQDGLDNNSNGLIDYPDDPACTSPNDNDEESSECLDSIDNDGDGDIDYPDDAGCQNVNDNNEGSAPPINFTFSANPALVRSGGTTALTWSVTAAKTGSCVITGNNGYYYDPTGNSGSVVTDPIFSKTIFTLTCEDLEGSEDSVSTEVQVIPAFKEV